MKKMLLLAGFILASLSVWSQSDGYIVKTKNVKKPSDSSVAADDPESKKKEMKALDFITQNFPYYSLCDWHEGMRFMVMPEKYDLIVNTFCDDALGKEVSSMTLRHKIMVYKDHKKASDGKERIYFKCEDDGRTYYYEIPNGTFADYCLGKLGVPTLAYLGDVDIAREKLKNKVMFTKATVYRIDTDYASDNYREVQVPANEEVTVVDIGVGTRNYPVKIIVKDKNGNEFYQNVALSRTNSGMRDDEFIDGNNAKFTFDGSFELQDAIMAVSSDYESYIGEIVHTKVRTKMQSKGDGKERTLTIPSQLSFKIESAQGNANSNYVTLTLEQTDTRRLYYKNVFFKNVDEIVEEANGKVDEYFGYVFAMGPGKEVETSQAARAAIREGRIAVGMTEDEVLLAIGEEPEKVEPLSNGRKDWHFRRSSGMLVVHFGRRGIVDSYTTPGEAKKQAQRQAATRRQNSSIPTRSRSARR